MQVHENNKSNPTSLGLFLTEQLGCLVFPLLPPSLPEHLLSSQNLWSLLLSLHSPLISWLSINSCNLTAYGFCLI